MERISSIISKKVISIDEGECIGYILNVCVDQDEKKIYGYLVCDDESEKINFLDCKHIKNIKDFVMVKNSNMLSFGENIESKNPIGKEVVTEDGISLGTVVDFEIQYKKIKKIITNKNEINPNNIFNWGNYLFFSEKKKRKIKNNYLFAKNNLINVQKVEIQKKEIKNNNQIQIPFKTSVSVDKLIGRISTSDIYGLNNELIIHKNEIITEKIIKMQKNIIK